MKYIVDFGHGQHTVEIKETADGVIVQVDDQPVTISTVSDPRWQKILMLLDGNSYDTEVFRNNGKTSVFLLGRQFDCIVEDQRLASIKEVAGVGSSRGDFEIKAPMPGLVTRLLKQVGDKVEKGESVVVVEAMKMENELKAPADGVIKEIDIEEGKAVDKGQLLISFE